jgi:hypothetical protein
MGDTTPSATCRGCGRTLVGKPYYMGGSAYVPGHKLEPARVNFYGGFVCSEDCDRSASLELERTMPGHGWDQARLTGPAADHLRRNWP